MNLLAETLTLNRSTLVALPFVTTQFPTSFVGGLKYHKWCMLFDLGLVNIFKWNENKEETVLLFRKNRPSHMNQKEALEDYFIKIGDFDDLLLYGTEQAIRLDLNPPEDNKFLSTGTSTETIFSTVDNPLGLFLTRHNVPFNLLFDTDEGKDLFKEYFQCTNKDLPDKLLPPIDREKETFRKSKILIY